MDWGTRRKPFGAIVAWGSLAVFAVLTILGIAGLVLSLQPSAASTVTVQVADVAPEPIPAPVVEERLPEELTVAEAQAKAADSVVAAEVGDAPQVVAAAEVVETPVAPEAAPAPQLVAAADVVATPALQVAVQRDDMIASTFDQLVTPVVVPAEQVPEGAVATVAAAPAESPTPAATAVAAAEVALPMSKDGSAQLAANRRIAVARNAAAWAIESEVPDSRTGNETALGYAAQPADDNVRVGEDSINVRSGPSQQNKKLFALAAGAEVDVNGKADGWVSITDAKDRDGWVDATLLTNLDLATVPLADDVPAVEPEKADDLKTVTGSGVTVRSGPGKSNKQLFNLAGGSDVTVLDDSKGWLKIKDAKGRTGWAYKSYIKG